MEEVKNEFVESVTEIKKETNPEEILQKKIDKLTKEYEKYIDKNLSIIRDTLQGYFPDEWEIKIKDINNSIRDYCSDTGSPTLGGLKGRINGRLFEILIHFPEITIKNSCQHSRKLLDLYIRIELNIKFANSNINYIPSYFGGWRATKEIEEYQSRYGHSHLVPFDVVNDSSCIFGRFCLGSTPFANLCAKLNHEFDEEDFAFFCQQLRDYVAWESLEGGPYIRMSSIGSSSNLITSPRTLSNSTYICIYKKFLQEDIKHIPFETYKLSGNTIQVDINRLKGNKDFNSILEKIVPDDYKVYFDPARNMKFVLNDSNGSTPLAIDEINKRYGKKVFFTFRGKDVKFQVLKNEAGEDLVEKYKNMERVVNPHIANYIANTLCNKMNTIFNNDTISVNHNE